MEKESEKLLKEYKDKLRTSAEKYDDIPGLNKRPFIITFPYKNPFKRNEMLTLGTKNIVKVKVIKTYEFTWWRKILFYLGFRIKSCDCIKVREQ